jgi:uncharacterized protein
LQGLFAATLISSKSRKHFMNKTYPTESWINPKIDVRSSPLHATGMYAKSLIKAGETVVIWGGNYVSKSEADKAKKIRKVVMQLDDDLYSIEDRGDDLTYFMNHSCDPNVWMKDAVTLIARTDIQGGNELTADYALWEGDENFISSWTCVCGSTLCRTKVTGKDWKIPELQKRYKNHFSPLINKRIAKTR